MISSDERATTPILGRYHDREVELRGSLAGLSALAAALRADAPARLALSTAASAAPYAGLLRTIAVEPTEGPVVISRDGDALTIRGDARRRAILADNVEATWTLHGPSGGDHVHVEYFDEHAYLGPGSIATVLVLEP